MPLSSISLLPPLLIIIIACITQSVHKALFSGIIFAAIIANNGDISEAFSAIFNRALAHLTNFDNITLYLFLLIISSLIAMFSQSGTILHATNIVAKKMKTKRAVEFSSITSSFILSIDDYLSILTAGFIMRPLADKFEICRTRLAYFVHSLSGPLVVLSPFSSWAATILIQFDNNGVRLENTPSTTIISDPFTLYVQVIPYIFYSILTVFSVIFLASTQFHPYRRSALFTNENSEPHHEIKKTTFKKNSTQPLALYNILIPIITLLGTIIVGFLYSGNYWLLGGTRGFMQAIQANDNTFLIMCIGSLSSFFAAFIILALQKTISFYQLPAIVWDGWRLIYGAITMVILASLFGTFIKNDLMTGTYIAQTLLSSVSLVFIPVIIFITSLIITLATGSAWGTFTLMIPIVIQMIISLQSIITPSPAHAILLLIPSLGATFSGSVCGDNISLFSETTAMTASAVGITPFQHFYSQLFYVYPVIIATLMAYLLSGLALYIPIFSNVFVLFLLSIFLVILIFNLQKVLENKLKNKMRTSNE